MTGEYKTIEVLKRQDAESSAGFAYVSETKTLAGIMDKLLREAKLGKAEWWMKGDTERVYVKNAKGKAAGFVEVVDGKFLYKEIVTEAFINVFRAARKIQKEQVA